MTLLLSMLGLTAVSFAQMSDQQFFEQVQSDTKWLSDAGTRQVGTYGHEKIQRELLEKVLRIPDVEIWTDAFDVVVPVYDQTYLQIDSGPLKGRHDTLYPMWPDGSRLNTTPQGGISGRLIYVGDAAYDRLPARGLQGQIAVMEMSAYQDYRRVFDFGAKAVIFLESKEPEKPLSTTMSLYKPRYYVPAGPLAEALRKNEIQSGTIVCQGQWQTVTARNIYVGVKPKDVTGELPYAIVAPYDSMSRVYGVAPGADVALDAAVVLNLLRDEAKAPSRPLLFGFLDAYHLNQKGMRRMAAMLTITPDGITRNEYADLEEADQKQYKQALEELEQIDSIDQGIQKLSQGSVDNLRRIFKDGVGRKILQLRELKSDLRLASARTDKEKEYVVRLHSLNAIRKAGNWLRINHQAELDPQDLEAIDDALAYVESEIRLLTQPDSENLPWTTFAEARDHAKKVLKIVDVPLKSRNRINSLTATTEVELKDYDHEIIKTIWTAMEERIRGQVEEQQQRIDYFKPMDELRNKIATFFGIKADQTIAAFIFGVDLSDSGVIVGPGQYCSYIRIPVGDNNFRRNIKIASKNNEIWPEGSEQRKAVNINRIEGRLDTDREPIYPQAMVTSPAKSFLIDNITWITDDAPRQRVDSPLDRYDYQDWSRIEPQLAPSRRFLEWFLTESDYQPKMNQAKSKTARWRHGMGKVVDISAGETVPRVPRPGFLVTLSGGGTDVDGIRRLEFAWTGHDGSFRIPLLPEDIHGWQKNLTLEAFRLNDVGAIVESISTTESQVSSRLATSFELGADPGDRLPRAVTFECVELNGPTFYDARFLEPLKSATLLDASRGSSPKQSYFKIDDTGQIWGLVEPGIRWQLVVRAGTSGVRMALMNAPEDSRQKKINMKKAFRRGFPVDQTLQTIPAEISARDIYTLNDYRLTDFKKAGISSDKIDEIHQQTEDSLVAAEQAAASDDGGKLRREAIKALASEIRAYRAISETGEDIARGAIFLMLILVPFSIAMERLVFAFPGIGGQITTAIGIFTAMTLLLWSFHPAFQISAQPLVIVMSFTILSMSLAVISIVMTRFRASMREFQSSLAEGSGAQMGRSGLLASAIFLGIANMRKRKMRTALTGTTLVLVTFALLCFSSASSYVDKKDFKLEGIVSTQPSVMIRRPTFGPIDWLAADGVQNLLNDQNVEIQTRAWLVSGLGDTNWRIWMMNPKTGEQVGARGMLGLPPREDEMSGVDRVLPNWSTFAEEGGCYLPGDLAELLGVEVGDKIEILGNTLTLRGIFNARQLDEDIDLLDGQRILPYDYSRQERDWIDRDTQGAIEQEMESASAMQPTNNENELFMPASDVVIVPTSVLRDLNGQLTSIAIPTENAEQASVVANQLMQTIVYPAYYTNKEGGVNVIVATPLFAVPPGSIFVPLSIAALIIFTTMLNSVSERKKEIYVYSSLGLAPMHIGALFVAEALTYGLMGSVFGYIAGQGFATLLTSFGLMQGITLNYSGTAVIRTMLLVQGVVLLSAIVPAWMAGRIASPSSEMDWKVPEPVDGEIKSTLPFTVSPSAANGLVAFIHEYLEAHRDGVLGRFDVDAIKLLPKDAEGRYVAGLESRVWLAPFDMGVRQMMRLTVEPPDDGVCEIAVSIYHETGTPKLWWRLNKPYFYELRRQMLGWRKITPERMQQYVQHMETMMDDRVVTNA